jgi:membrane-bound ClpP family serine protease
MTFGEVHMLKALLASLSLLLLPALVAPAARAGEPLAEGIFISVPNPITSDVFYRVMGTTERYLKRVKEAGMHPDVKIIYDFNPTNESASTRDFGPCRDLAKFIGRQQGVRTIAFVHKEATAHTVLPILACNEIVMSSEARLGNVRRYDDPHEAVEPDVEAAYDAVAKNRRCPAIVLKMLHRDMVILKATKVGAGGVWYIDKGRLAEAEREGYRPNPDPVLGTGPASTLYTQQQAQQFGLAALMSKENRQEVAEAYGLGPASLREDPLMGRSPVAWRIDVSGPVTPALKETLQRQVGRAIGDKSHAANLIILQLVDCGGGDIKTANELARWLRDLKDDKGEYPVMTVAYIPKSAPDTAAFLALGCTEIVMNKDATFGDFSDIITQKKGGAVVNVDPDQYKATRETLEDLAKKQGYPVLLVRGLMDRKLEIWHAVNRTTKEEAFLTREELDRDPEKWVNEQLIKPGDPNGEAKPLSADKARQWRIASHTVDGLNEMYAVYGVNPAQVRTASYDWLDAFAEFLRRTEVRIILVMVGIVCLLLELKMPGVGIPGVIAAVCFILFFWAHAQTEGLVLLGVLLFVLGLILLGLEIFVLPGFGVAGISGIILIVFSLALVALEKRPQTSAEWLALLKIMAQFGVALSVAVVLAVMLVSYLPNIPYLNKLILKPKADTEAVGEDVPDSVRPETAALLGALGVAATPLRPAGKVKFGDDYIDVVAEGSYVEAGARVQVVEIEGNRVVVKEVL